MNNDSSIEIAPKYSLVVLFIIFLIFSVTSPGKQKISAPITQSLLEKKKRGEIEDPVFINAIELGILDSFIESKIVESNYLIFKIFTVNDRSVIESIQPQAGAGVSIKYIGIAGQVICLEPEFNCSLVSTHRSKIVTTKETEVYITEHGPQTKMSTKSTQKSGYHWDVEIINDGSVDYFKDFIQIGIYRKSWAAAILNIASPGREVTLSFDWEIESEGWAGTPAISVVNSLPFSVKDCDLALKRNCGDIIAIGNKELRMRHFGITRGSYQTVIRADQLIFYIIPAETSGNEGHANTYFKIYNFQIL